MPVPMDVILVQAVDDWLQINPQGKMSGSSGPIPDRPKIKSNIVDQTRLIIDAQNALLPKGDRIKPPNKLENIQIARIIYKVERVERISCSETKHEDELDLLGVYQESGENEGTYDASNTALNQLIAEYNCMAGERDEDAVRHYLKRDLKAKMRCMNPDLIPVNNGIFDYKNKVLLPFSPDKIFLTKSSVDYNPNAQNITIRNPKDGTTWDLESWVAGLSDDPEIVNLLWEILGAINRPFVSWDKSAWFYSAEGCSGKGTFCELLRNLRGKDNYASISLEQFSQRFHLEPLVHASAVICDENDVGTFIDKSANLKAAITNDALLIDRKFKDPITFQFYGLVVQCLNEYPRIKDTSDSFYRRQLFIPFDKCFTGKERKYIKDDYLSRKEVLEYVMFKTLNMNYYELSEPKACQLALRDVKNANDPVREFVDDILPQCRWDLLPFTFLFPLYEKWYKETNPSGMCLGRNKFILQLYNVIQKNPDWECKNKKSPIPTKNLMDGPEPLILKYGLTEWMNPNYRGTDPHNICMPALYKEYRGLVRRVPRNTQSPGYVVAGNEPFSEPHPLTENSYRQNSVD